MSKPSTTCPICYRLKTRHTYAEVTTCKTKIEKRRSGLQRANFSLKNKMLVMEKQQGRCFIIEKVWCDLFMQNFYGRIPPLQS